MDLIPKCVQAVKKSVETALLHMTEKKMHAEMKLKEALAEITQKDARIKELEDIVKNLSGGGTSQQSVADD